jgi:hypothetical protein
MTPTSTNSANAVPPIDFKNVVFIFFSSDFEISALFVADAPWSASRVTGAEPVKLPTGRM